MYINFIGEFTISNDILMELDISKCKLLKYEGVGISKITEASLSYNDNTQAHNYSIKLDPLLEHMFILCSI